MDLHSIQTPSLVVDRTIVAANCEAMARRATRAGVSLRPHMKTGKAKEIAERREMFSMAAFAERKLRPPEVEQESPETETAATEDSEEDKE